MKFFPAAVLLLAVPLAADGPLALHCEGFAEPLHKPGLIVDQGRVLPLRIRVLNEAGTAVDDTAIHHPPELSLTFIDAAGAESDASDQIEAWDFGDSTRFVYREGEYWKYDFGTNRLIERGRYRISVDSGDAKEYKLEPCRLDFELTPPDGSSDGARQNKKPHDR